MLYQAIHPPPQSRTTFLAVKSLDLYVGEFDDYFLYWSLIGQNMYIQMLYLSRCLILTHPLCRSVIEGGRLVSLALTANWLLGLHIPVMWDLCRVPSYLWDFKSPAPLKYCFSYDPRSSYLSKSWLILFIVAILIADKTCLWLIGRFRLLVLSMYYRPLHGVEVICMCVLEAVLQITLLNFTRWSRISYNCYHAPMV